MDVSLTTMENLMKVIGVLVSNMAKANLDQKRVLYRAFGTMVNFREKCDYYLQKYSQSINLHNIHSFFLRSYSLYSDPIV
jgi:hypothetical protein